MSSRIKKISGLILATILVFTMIVGCTQKDTSQTGSQPTTKAPATTTKGSDVESNSMFTGMFQIKGSDTEVNLVQRLTEVYNEKQPGVQFAVTGGGSGTGIAALIDKQIDVANSSRPMKESEIEQAKANGVNPVPFIFAQDGLAVIVNADNPVESLTMDQIGAIYRGEIKNWREVGGADQALSTYGRQSSSGTYVYFMETVVKGDYTEHKKMLSGNANIVEGVIADKAGIGYVGIGYAVDGGSAVKGLKILKVSKDANSAPSSPAEIENILQGIYPIVRPLYHYTDGTPEGALKDYLEFIFSPKGQAIIEEEGFYPITAAYQEFNKASLAGMEAPVELSGMYQIKGSDTEVNMVQRLTEIYNEKQPKVQFAVTGGGSGTGIAALIDKQIDVANSSRPMKDSEIDQAKANGVDPVPFIFAQDGLAVVVNADNPVDALTLAQIGAIYRGEIKNWSEVGGDNQALSTYGRQSSSGTYVYFMEKVVQGDYSAEMKMLSGNANIVEGVIADKAGIGYIGVGYAVDGGTVVSGLKVLKVAADSNSDAASPLEIENILTGKYPIVRPLFHYTDGKPTGALKDYLMFVFSNEGQKAVENEGFFPITNEHQQLNQEGLK